MCSKAAFLKWHSMLREACRTGESGNVLFLILIAVCLFAALTYAVTESSRSGGGNASSEANLISSSELTQYMTGIQGTLVRMAVSNSITPDQLLFNPPSDFESSGGQLIRDISGADPKTNASVRQSVYHPWGGGMPWRQAPKQVMANGAPGTWYFNRNWAVPYVGSVNNELTAFLPGISASMCRKINQQLGISPMPVMSASMGPSNTDVEVSQISDPNNIWDPPNIYPYTNAPPACCPNPMPAVSVGDISSQHYACVDNNDGTYTYYHVLIEQ